MIKEFATYGSGTHYFEENIEKFGERARNFDLPDETLQEIYTEKPKRLYEYYFDILPGQIISDPKAEIPYSKFMIYVNGLPIAYVLDEDIQTVGEILPAITKVQVKITGGGFKDIAVGGVAGWKNRYRVDVIVSYDDAKTQQFVRPQKLYAVPIMNQPVKQPAKQRKTWLWVLGWILIFPLPLTILLLRHKTMKSWLKYGIIALACVIYLLIAIGVCAS